jgi:hypothetical protein
MWQVLWPKEEPETVTISGTEGFVGHKEQAKAAMQ